MEDFKKKLTQKYRLIAYFCCCALLICFGLMRFVKGADDFAVGLVSGMFSGIMIVSVFNLARIHKALHNEEKLKEMYIQQTDERNVAIGKETMKTSSFISIMVTALAVIVSGFFNPIISITLAISLIADSVITIAVKSYYNKKM
ncbi:MAG: hypothetical protein K2L10_05180 [Ruminococcus sp.]|nr:hypothetical protein [Ruminococcus sp.]